MTDAQMIHFLLVVATGVVVSFVGFCVAYAICVMADSVKADIQRERQRRAIANKREAERKEIRRAKWADEKLAIYERHLRRQSASGKNDTTVVEDIVRHYRH